MLRGNPDFNTVLEWIAENRDAAGEECCEHIDNDLLRRAQGSRKAMQHILQCNTEAPKVLEKFNAHKK